MVTVQRPEATAGQTPDEDGEATRVLTFLVASVREATYILGRSGAYAPTDTFARFVELAEEEVSEGGGGVLLRQGGEVIAAFSTARKALLTAAAVQHRFADEIEPTTPFGAGIGIAIGEAAPVGSGFTGPALNLAKMLCGLARPSEILATEDAVRLASLEREFTQIGRGSVESQGLVEAVRVVQLTPVGATAKEDGLRASRATNAARSGDNWPLPIGRQVGSLPSRLMVGREEELAAIQGALEAAADERGGILLVSGPPGIGKTRLIQEATLLAYRDGFRIAAGSCGQESRLSFEAASTGLPLQSPTPEPQQHPGLPFLSLLEPLATAAAIASPETWSHIRSGCPELVRLLGIADANGLPVINSGHPPEAEENLADQIVEFLVTLSRDRPLAMFVDDLQWADDSSLRLLSQLGHRIHSARILVIAAFADPKPEQPVATLQNSIRELAHDRLAQHVRLGPLSADDTAEMVSDIVGDMEMSDEFQEFVYLRTKGVPALVDEVITSLGGRYRLVREIGAGGMGRVFEAIDGQTGSPVAAKIMFAAKGAEDESARRFMQEGAMLAQLEDPNIVKVYGTFMEQAASCIVMELLGGHSLRAELRGRANFAGRKSPNALRSSSKPTTFHLSHKLDPERDGADHAGEAEPSTPSLPYPTDRASPESDNAKLRLLRAKNISLQVASALRIAHERGIVHRDVKPDNIMLAETDDVDCPGVKVTDFGIARILRKEQTLLTITTTGMTLGTPSYMSPEQVEGREVDSRTDIYALGAVLFEMTTGRPPFEGEDALSIAVKHVHESPVPPSHVNPQLPHEWDRVILKSLAKDPGQRYQQVVDMAHAIEALPETPVRPTLAMSIHRKVRTAPAKRLGAVLAVAILATLAVVISLTWPRQTAVGGAGVQTSLGHKVDRFLTGLAAHNNVSGAAVVERGGKVILSKGYGWADRAHHIKNGPNVKYPTFGSLMGIMAALRLERAHKLDLRRSVCAYLDRCPKAWSRMTVQQVVSGTSGLQSASLGSSQGTTARSVELVQKYVRCARGGRDNGISGLRWFDSGGDCTGCHWPAVRYGDTTSGARAGRHASHRFAYRRPPAACPCGWI